jgi:hypothetical protein
MAKPSVDPFDPVNLQLPEEIVSELEKRQQSIRNNGEVRRRSQSKKFGFYRFPAEVLESVAIAGKSPALIILCVLYRLRVKTGHNPVILSSRTLRNFGLSRHQKLRGLKLLEKTGHISVDRTYGRNLKIMLNWWPH